MCEVSATKGNTLLIHFGALADKIDNQLATRGLSADPKTIAHWQKDADAISRLSIRDLLTESQTRMARQKLLKTICRTVHPVPMS